MRSQRKIKVFKGGKNEFEYIIFIFVFGHSEATLGVLMTFL